MAQAIACDLCGDEVAVILANGMTDGSSMAVGQRCFVPYGLGLASGMIGEMPADIVKEYSDLVADIAVKCGVDTKALTKARKRAETGQPDEPASPDIETGGDGDEPADVMCSCCETIFPPAEVGADGTCGTCAAGHVGEPCA